MAYIRLSCRGLPPGEMQEATATWPAVSFHCCTLLTSVDGWDDDGYADDGSADAGKVGALAATRAVRASPPSARWARSWVNMGVPFQDELAPRR